jgi:Flp pilus assembly pilin Flp
MRLTMLAKDQSGATAIEYGLMAAAGIAAALLLDGLGGGPLSR